MLKEKRGIYIKNKLRFFTFLTILFFVSILIISFIFTYKVKGYENSNMKTVIVSRGDTLWDIAREHTNKEYDIRNEIYSIKEINNLETSNIYPGQELIVPIRR